MSAKYVVGIDLGTTHTALAAAPIDVDGAVPEVFAVPQLVGRGQLEARPLLPSFLYFGHESDGALPLPWDANRGFAVGEFARSRGVESPNRLLASAKSWLCHAGIDRRAGVLPVGGADDVEKISPVEASFRYLDHLSEAWAAAHPDAPLGEQQVFVTVPASFDPDARDLTVEAAYAAGIENVTLLEEPQAALYAWIAANGDGWRKLLKVGDVLLVVDIGGGTTDFSAIAVTERDGELQLERIAVGEHILLGGDNMDLALAQLTRQKLVAQGKQLDRFQLHSLGFGCRAAKERLLGVDAPESVAVVVPSRGSQLLGGSLRTELTRAEVHAALLDGFFPSVAAEARPATRARGGLTQLGLPYAADAGVTRHLAAFLARQADAVTKLPGFEAHASRPLLCPTRVLFNGGVVKAPAIRERLLQTLNAWLTAVGAPEATVLPGEDPDLAVARGAAYFGLVRRGRGLRIRGGTARAYYVGIEAAAPAIPGLEPPISALCVAPFGMEEGTEASLPPHELGVVVGEPVRFRFFGSTTRREDEAGVELDDFTVPDLDELAPIEITLPAEGRPSGTIVPIRLRSSVTPVGTLLLEAAPLEPRTKDERWKIELTVRGDGATDSPSAQ